MLTLIRPPDVNRKRKRDALKILSFYDDKKGISANPRQNELELTLCGYWGGPS